MEHQQSKNRTSLARKLLYALLAAGIILLGLHLLLQALNLLIYHQQHGQIYELSNRFDFDDEHSVPTWFSQFLFLLIAVTAGLSAYLERERVARWLWGIVGVTAFLGSIDEVAGLHEFALQTLHVMFYQDAKPGNYSNAWLLVLPFIIAIAVVFLYVMLRRLPRRTVIFFAAAVAVFLTGAIGIDIIASVSERESFLNQGVLVGLEESFELLSLIVIIYAISDYLELHHGSRLRAALHGLKR